jgi:hypothetical protein
MDVGLSPERELRFRGRHIRGLQSNPLRIRDAALKIDEKGNSPLLQYAPRAYGSTLACPDLVIRTSSFYLFFNFDLAHIAHRRPGSFAVQISQISAFLR